MISDAWDKLLDEINQCAKCDLCHGRTNAVPGEGNIAARVMVVGEGPGEQEDLQGRPFVGPAGKLLDKMLASIGLAREDVYIANVVKCRPPGNRTPSVGESEQCFDYLVRQITLVDPAIILCMGTPSMRRLMDDGMRVTRDRGVWMEKDGRALIATFHPAALLRDYTLMIDSWRDMQALKARLERL